MCLEFIVWSNDSSCKGNTLTTLISESRIGFVAEELDILKNMVEDTMTLRLFFLKVLFLSSWIFLFLHVVALKYFVCPILLYSVKIGLLKTLILRLSHFSLIKTES